MDHQLYGDPSANSFSQLEAQIFSGQLPPSPPWPNLDVDLDLDLDAWSVRWVILHVINELARHAGHADIIRESIDGATMYELIAGLENWEPQPWLTPWKSPGTRSEP